MGSLRVGHDWATSLSLSLFTFLHWRRKWQPTPVFLPEESRDGKAWWVAVYGIAQSRTRLKWLCSSNTVKGFGVFNEAEVDVFSGTLLLFQWSSGCWRFDLIPLPFLTSLNICKFTAHDCWSLASKVMVKILQARLQQQKMYSSSSLINLRSTLTVIFHTPHIPHQIPSLQNIALNKQLSLVLPLLPCWSKLSSSLISYC